MTAPTIWTLQSIMLCQLKPLLRWVASAFSIPISRQNCKTLITLQTSTIFNFKAAFTTLLLKGGKPTLDWA